jgi:hypothetical protein
VTEVLGRREVLNMKQLSKKTTAQALAEAALRLSQRVHECYPQAVLTALEVPFTDEDLTIEVSLPEDYSIQDVSDMLIRCCLEIEDELGVSILTQACHAPQAADAG